MFKDQEKKSIKRSHKDAIVTSNLSTENIYLLKYLFFQHWVKDVPDMNIVVIRFCCIHLFYLCI